MIIMYTLNTFHIMEYVCIFVNNWFFVNTWLGLTFPRVYNYLVRTDDYKYIENVVM